MGEIIGGKRVRGPVLNDSVLNGKVAERYDCYASGPINIVKGVRYDFSQINLTQAKELSKVCSLLKPKPEKSDD